MASLNTTRSKSALPPQGGRPPQAFEPSNTLRTYEGAPAALISDEMALRRTVCSCLLWESEFYEDGKTIADRIIELVGKVPTKIVTDLAVDARSHFNLRHVPLLLLAALAAPGRGGTHLIGDAIAEAIQRPDELSEFVAIYAKVYGVEPKSVRKRLSAQVKRGLALAFTKFDCYQLAKYFSTSGESDAVVRGRDVMFLTHPRPRDESQAELWKLVAGKQPIQKGGADTWETALSSGADKKETFTRLLQEQKLGYMAVLRNLRNMEQAGVDRKLVENAILARRGARRVMPFRYVAAARACPQYEQVIDQALSEAISELPELPGLTAIMVDVSGSMEVKLSARSDLTRMDAAAALASLIHGRQRVFSFSNWLKEVKPQPGMAGIRAILGSQPHSGTELGNAVQLVNSMGDIDRLIVITDEQSHSYVPEPLAKRAYMINVSSAQNGVGYGERWIHLDGFSEQIIRWIHEFEAL